MEEPSDAAAKREEKIARYKRCKELDEKVAYLRLEAVFYIYILWSWYPFLVGLKGKPKGSTTFRGFWWSFFQGTTSKHIGGSSKKQRHPLEVSGLAGGTGLRAVALAWKRGVWVRTAHRPHHLAHVTQKPFFLSSSHCAFFTLCLMLSTLFFFTRGLFSPPPRHCFSHPRVKATPHQPQANKKQDMTQA